MDALLHWDFSPGLALAAQVRRKFGSQVHFSPSPYAKEFFLVVAFSSASFALNEESVGLDLECCLGGDSSGFRVYQLSDLHFRFSAASNKVGHFIYSLRDRVWPDFVCHFTLFRGTHPSISGLGDTNSSSWRSDAQIPDVALRSRTNWKPNLNFLKKVQLWIFLIHLGLNYQDLVFILKLTRRFLQSHIQGF